MLGVTVNVDLGSAKAVLQTLQRDRLERLLISAMRKAMGPVVSAVRAAAPVGHSSVGKSHLAGRLQRSIAFRIDTSQGLRARIVATPYGRLVERGHRIVIGGRAAKEGHKPTARQTGRVVGQVPPHPFASPVVERMTPQIEQSIASEVQNAVALAARIRQAQGRAV